MERWDGWMDGWIDRRMAIPGDTKIALTLARVALNRVMNSFPPAALLNTKPVVVVVGKQAIIIIPFNRYLSFV